MNTSFYLVRHGETLANVQGLVCGHHETDLTKEGEQQAESRAHDLDAIEFDGVYCSDYIRARRTAEILKKERALEVQATDLLRERNYGKFEGKLKSEMKTELEVFYAELKKLSDEEQFSAKYEEWHESESDMARRVLQFLRELAMVHSDERLLVVTHGGVLKAVLVALGYATTTEIPSGAVENLAYLQLESDGVDFWIKDVVGVNVVRA